MGIAQYDETATTTMTKDNNASLRFKDVMEAIERDILVPVSQKCMTLNQQFLSEEKAIRVTSDEQAGQLLMIAPDAIHGNYDVLYVGTAIDAMANKEMARERTLQAFAMMSADPLYQQDSGARLALMRKVLEALEIKNIDALLPQAMMQPGMEPPGVEPPGFSMPGMEQEPPAEMMPSQNPIAQAVQSWGEVG